jgi:hypothetical protein
MQESKVKCPNCKRVSFVTTPKFNPNVTPNGSMVKCILPFHIDWLTKSTTKVAEMTCPRCLAQLAPKGRLTVVKPVVTIRPCDVLPGEVVLSKSVQKRLEAQGAFLCPICNDGRQFKSQIALNGHMKKHEKGR